VCIIALVATDDPEVGALLHAYLDAVALVEPAQARLWQSARLTLVQIRILRHLRETPRSAGQLGRAVGLSPTSITRVIDRLEERGLVTRRRDEQDRRRVEVRIAPEGLRVLGEVKVLKGTSLHRAMEAMPPDQRRRVTEALGELIEHARSYLAEAEPEAVPTEAGR
jgi:DNA-binding MarR family transcriptional regulator